MERRRLLAAIGGAAGTPLAAGCLSDFPARSTGTDTGAEPGTDAGSGSPTPERPTECPEYDRVDRVVCYDGADLDAVDASLDPSDRTVGLGEPIEFTLRNRSDRTLRTNFHNWNVHRHVDGEWYHVAPRFWNQPLMSVPPGEEHTWTATFENAGVEAGDPVPTASGTDDLTIAGVGGGHYAFRGRGWFEGDTHEEAVAFAATFTLDAGPLELTPTDAIEETTREGDTLVAHSTRGDPDDEDYRLGAFELERVEDPDGDVRRTIVEQVVRNHRLRDALALAEEHGVDRVRIEEYDATHPIFGRDPDRPLEFRGSYYEVTTREIEGGE